MIANYWIHNGRVDLAGEKMSKSLGNVLWADDLLDRIPVQVYRLMMLNVPYRQLLNYKEELVNQTATDYEKIKRAYVSLYRKLELEDKLSFDVCVSTQEILDLTDEFKENMGNDFNTANAITTIFKLTKLINTFTRQKDIDVKKLQDAMKALDDMLWVLGITPTISLLNEEEKQLVLNWNKYKAAKDFEKADELRKIILEKNILL